MEVSVWPSSAFHNFDHLKTFYVFPTLQRPTRSSQIKMQAKFASSYHRSARTTKTTFFENWHRGAAFCGFCFFGLSTTMALAKDKSEKSETFEEGIVDVQSWTKNFVFNFHFEWFFNLKKKIHFRNNKIVKIDFT